MQIDFDPALVSYAELLDLFWEYHDATMPAYDRQYRSVILYADEQQQKVATTSKEKLEKISAQKIYTEIEPLKVFTLAENYHQKYYLRQRSSLMSDLQKAYPIEIDFINATVSARLNAVASGIMNYEILTEVLSSPVLSEANRQRLLNNKQKVP